MQTLTAYFFGALMIWVLISANPAGQMIRGSLAYLVTEVAQ